MRSVLSGAVVGALCLAGAIGCGVHTAPFRDGRGQVIPGSVATMADFLIGGIEQRLWFRAAEVANPAVIVLHGGPGASATALFRGYNASLEQRFLMVYWDQRGTGRSYHSRIPAESMTIEQFVRDLDEVVELVRRRFAKDKVVLLGHSWGSAIGILYAARFPDKVAAYVGVGQVADMREGERLSYEFARAEASRRKHRGAMRELDRIGFPPHDVDQMLTSRKWMERFGGAFHGNLSKGKMIWAALGTDEANLIDLIKFGQGNRFSLTRLWDEFREFDVDETLVSFRTPIVFFLGRHDWQVPAVVAARYFDRIEAPNKRVVWFEQSAHNPPFEEPALFNRTLVDVLEPLVHSDTAGAAEAATLLWHEFRSEWPERTR
jgi:pimeloyl-ACP methyl ester carboxylesterase